jgi:hypothetical protein
VATEVEHARAIVGFGVLAVALEEGLERRDRARGVAGGEQAVPARERRRSLR